MSAPIFATNAFAPHNFPARIQATQWSAAFTPLQREKSRGSDFSTSLRISTVKRHECRAPSISRIRRGALPEKLHQQCSRPPTTSYLCGFSTDAKYLQLQESVHN